jgi:hypothetical protein
MGLHGRDVMLNPQDQGTRDRRGSAGELDLREGQPGSSISGGRPGSERMFSPTWRVDPDGWGQARFMSQMTTAMMSAITMIVPITPNPIAASMVFRLSFCAREVPARTDSKRRAR